MHPFWRIIAAVLFIACCMAPLAASAQGGPPFRTDDPETPGNRHFEINFGFIGERNPSAGAYQVPDFDFNYGWGDRIQLKYELPIAIAETRVPGAFALQPNQDKGTIGGLGESLLGVKYRFYEHHPGDPWIGRNPPSKTKETRSEPPDDATPVPDEPVVNFSVGTYPQLSLNNPTRSVARGVVPGGPDFFLPLEVNGRIGPLRFDGETGYHFGNRNLPQSWIRGLILGHEFTDRTEAYVEIYDEQDANRIDGIAKQRETTLGLGGRQALNRDKTLNLLLMGGRSFQSVSNESTQPSWIAYVGLQVLLGPKERVERQVEQKQPDEGK